MISQMFHLPKYNWSVKVFYSVTCYHTREILEELKACGCDKEFMDDAEENMESCQLNTGLTFSNLIKNESVMVIAKTSSTQEFSNSLAHESQHLLMHIARRYNIDVYGEEICYLSGDIAESMHPITKNLLSGCKCGRKRLGIA